MPMGSLIINMNFKFRRTNCKDFCSMNHRQTAPRVLKKTHTRKYNHFLEDIILQLCNLVHNVIRHSNSHETRYINGSLSEQC